MWCVDVAYLLQAHICITNLYQRVCKLKVKQVKMVHIVSSFVVNISIFLFSIVRYENIGIVNLSAIWEMYELIP